MSEINFESEILILNIDPRSTSKEFKNKKEILRSFISLHEKYNKLKHSCKDDEFDQFHNKLTSNADNSCLFYTGIEVEIKEKYEKSNTVKGYEAIIKQMYANAVIDHKIIKTKMPCDKNKDQKRLVSILFHVSLNNST